MKTIRITRNGVFRSGLDMVPIGTEVDVPDDFNGWPGKWELVSEIKGKTLEPATPEPTPVEDITDYGESEQDDKPRPAKRRGRPRKEAD